MKSNGSTSLGASLPENANRASFWKVMHLEQIRRTSNKQNPLSLPSWSVLSYGFFDPWSWDQ